MQRIHHAPEGSGEELERIPTGPRGLCSFRRIPVGGRKPTGHEGRRRGIIRSYIAAEAMLCRSRKEGIIKWVGTTVM